MTRRLQMCGGQGMMAVNTNPRVWPASCSQRQGLWCPLQDPHQHVYPWRGGWGGWEGSTPTGNGFLSFGSQVHSVCPQPAGERTCPYFPAAPPLPSNSHPAPASSEPSGPGCHESCVSCPTAPPSLLHFSALPGPWLSSACCAAPERGCRALQGRV